MSCKINTFFPFDKMIIKRCTYCVSANDFVILRHKYLLITL